MNISIDEAAKTVASEFPQATDQDKIQLANAAKAKGAHSILSSVPNPSEDKEFNEEGAQKGKGLILNSLKQSASLTKGIFEVIRMCEDEEIVYQTFRIAEIRAIKACRDMQVQEEKEAQEKHTPGYIPSKPIKTLGDIAKWSGNAGVLSYQTTLKKMLNIMTEAERTCELVQEWYNYQTKHDGEAQQVVHPNFLNPWSERYMGSLGWKQYTLDARSAQFWIATYTARKLKDEAGKGREAARALASAEHVEQSMAQLGSGGRTSSKDLADSTLKCWQAFHTAFYEAADELPVETINGFLSDCLKNLRVLVSQHREAKAQNTAVQTATSETTVRAPESAGVEPTVGANDAETGQDVQSVGAGELSSAPELVKPEWIDQQDWDTADADIRALMIEEGPEKYAQEKAYMMQHEHDTQDAASNE